MVKSSSNHQDSASASETNGMLNSLAEPSYQKKQDPPTMDSPIQFYYKNPQILEQLNDYIRVMDLGIQQVQILPKGNESDLDDIPKEVRAKIKIHLVTEVLQAFRLALTKPATAGTGSATVAKARPKKKAAAPR